MSDERFDSTEYRRRLHRSVLFAVPHRQGMKGKKEFHCKDLMSPHPKRQILKWGKA